MYRANSIGHSDLLDFKEAVPLDYDFDFVSPSTEAVCIMVMVL